MALQNKKSRSIIKPLFVTIIIAAAVAVGYGLYTYAFDKWPFVDRSDTATESTDSGDPSDDPNFVDDQPATDEDQELANKNKQEAYERQQQENKDDQSANKSTGSQKSVSVTLTTFYKEGDSIHANGFVAGVVENGGTCTLTLTNESGKSVSASRKGHVNATNTTCGQSSINLNKLSPGKWTPELSYSSSTSKGSTGPGAWEAIQVN